MRSLKDLLSLRKIPGAELSEIRHQCAQIATELLQTPVQPTQVTYHDGEVLFSVPPLLKTELVIRHEELVARLTKAGIKVSSVR